MDKAGALSTAADPRNSGSIPVWKNWLALLLVWPLAWLIYHFMTTIAGMLAGLLINESGAAITVDGMPWLQMICSGCSMALAVFLIHFYLLQKSWEQCGLAWKGYAHYAAIGALTALFILMQFSWLMASLGIVSFTGIEPSIEPFMKYLVAMCCVAVGEELLFRQAVIANLPRHWPKWFALCLSAIIFGIAHLQNPGHEPLAMLGVFAGGLLLGVNYVFTGNLWFGIALHVCWNFLLGPILGFAVSGHYMNAMLTQASLQGPEWLTGGSFGPEASVLIILLNLGTASVLYYRWNRQQTTNTAISEP